MFSSRRKLQRLEAELEKELEEIKDIEQLTETEQSRRGSVEAEDLKSRRKRAEQLEKDITREKERLGLFESERAWVPGDTRNMAIGQGNILVSPLQMARMVAAIANGGKLLRPHLVAHPGASYVERTLPVSPVSLATVRSAMRRVVFGRRGTARQKELRKHDVAAKTGTAELGGDLNNGWIIGFAPYDRPRIAFAVVAERTKLHGGDVAGPVLAKILDAYFDENKK